MSGDFILIVDYGGSQAQAIARMLRNDRIFCHVVRAKAAVREMKQPDCRGVLLAGRPLEADAVDRRLLDSSLPVLALGETSLSLCLALGGQVLETVKEDSIVPVSFLDSPLFEGLTESDRYFQRLCQIELDGACSSIATVPEEEIPAFACVDKPIYALQFSVESNDPDGLTILSNFARTICGCDPWWTLETFAEQAIASIREKVGGKTALMTISGGLDSTVCAALVRRAVGDSLRCVYVNNGLMRLGETELVRETFRQHLGMELYVVEAGERFLNRLSGVTDPAQKRACVADEMLKTLSEEVNQLGPVDFLVQGTIYPDVLSADNPDNGAMNDRATLKDHIAFGQLLEPLRMLFKGEVRRLGAVLGLPEAVLYRQPFPEAGLAVRCIGEVTSERLDLLGRADAIFRQEIMAAGLDKRIWQYFAVLTDTMSRGLRDGKPVYEQVLALRAVSSKDAISAYSYRLPYDLLERVMERVTTEVPGITRVLYDVTGKPPAMIEWE